MLSSHSITKPLEKSSKMDKYRKLVRNIKLRKSFLLIPTIKCSFQTLEKYLVKIALCWTESTLKDWPNSRRKNLREKWKKKSKRTMSPTKTSSLEVKPRGKTQAKMTKTPHLWTRGPRPPWNSSFRWTRMKKIYSGRDREVILFRIWFSRKMMINTTPRILKTWKQEFKKAKLSTMCITFRETTAMRSLSTFNSRENCLREKTCSWKVRSLRKNSNNKMILMPTKTPKRSSWAKSRWST